MSADWAEAGMPDVDDQRRASFGACGSMLAHRDFLKGRFSGPCSWIMVAFETASESDEARVSRCL